ncbi:MAG TPA: extracellular solute-binding protein [Chloroflexota bacterium]|jgi:ABC-type glycerol-3-phosphate transport system substrate-binding protein|nr:extracellular solute-binding protein [Chloroflexota bacterium]
METRRATRRWVCGGAAGAAGTALLAACGGQASQSGGAQPGGATRQPATVRYLHFDTGQQVWQTSWASIFSSFTDQYPEWKVQADSVTQSLNNIAEKAIVSYAGGETYELFYGHFTILGAMLAANILEPLDGFLARDREVKAEDYYPAATERMKGKLYGIAWFTQGKELFYNANLLADAGAPSPRQLEREGKWTWDALLDVARKVTRMEGEQVTVYGFNTGYGDPGTFVNNLYAWGADFFDKDFTRATIDTPPFLAATQFAVDMVAKHKVSGGGNFQQGSLGILLGSGSSTRGWDEQIVRQNLFQIEHTMLPKGPASRAAAMANNCLYLGKGAKAPEAAWAFYKHLVSNTVQPQIAQLGGGRYTASKKLKPVTLFPFEDAAVYEASAAILRPTPLIVRQTEFQQDWAAAWKDLVEGKQGVKDALTQMQERATLWLKDGCIC